MRYGTVFLRYKCLMKKDQTKLLKKRSYTQPFHFFSNKVRSNYESREKKYTSTLEALCKNNIYGGDARFAQ